MKCRYCKAELTSPETHACSETIDAMTKAREGAERKVESMKAKVLSDGAAHEKSRTVGGTIGLIGCGALALMVIVITAVATVGIVRHLIAWGWS